MYVCTYVRMLLYIYVAVFVSKVCIQKQTNKRLPYVLCLFIFYYEDAQTTIAHSIALSVVFVGDASKRLCEDYLRILRYFRFHGRLARDHNHDPATLQVISQ